MTYQVRVAKESEYEAIDTLAVAAWQTLKTGYASDAWPGIQAAVGRMSTLAARGTLLVAIKEKQAAGAVCYLPAGTSPPDYLPPFAAGIRMLVTSAAHRKRGIGRLLLQECIDRAAAEGATHIGLHTSPIMESARRLYSSLGFEKDQNLPPLGGAPYERQMLKLPTEP